MITTSETIDRTVENYENTRELVDLLITVKQDLNILKSAIGNLVDANFGSTHGWTEEREVGMLADRLQISREMARVILQACDDTREANAYDLI